MGIDAAVRSTTCHRLALLQNNFQKITTGESNEQIISRTDPVVCPDCNIEDALLSNMIRDIAENTAYTVRIVFWFRIASCQRLGLLEFRVLGFGGSVFFNLEFRVYIEFVVWEIPKHWPYTDRAC